MIRLGALALCAAACSRPATPTTEAPAKVEVPALPDAGVIDATEIDAAVTAQLDRDGNDDPEDPGTGSAPTAATFQRLGAPPLALQRICDLTPLGRSLYAAHARSPLGSDGATISRYTPGAKKPFAVAFDWNRPGEKKRGGAAGQGFLRLHAIDGRLFVPDADSPYNGLGLVERGTESYLFVSAPDGTFAPARMPGHRPPATAAILPRAYHVLDAIQFRGGLFASTGSVPPTERAWHGPSPGALHRANEDRSRWIYEVDYPFPYQDGVWRLTFLVRFRDRLYAGIQDYDGREPNDYVVIAPGTEPHPKLERAHLSAVRITDGGGAGTLRWWVDPVAHRLYWLAWERGTVVLRFTTDGDTWTKIDLPAGAGRPSDITRFRDAVVVLTERGLWRLDGAGFSTMPIVKIDDKVSPFEVNDLFCAAPLAVFDNELYAGGQIGGALYKLVATP